MKQVLSVADFATILRLVDSEISQVEYRATTRNNDILNSQYYLNLKHLKESLQNLNVEVETPDVEFEKVGGESDR